MEDLERPHLASPRSGEGTGWSIWCAPTWPPRVAGRERAGVFGAPPPGLPAERGGNGLEYLVRPHLASPWSGEGTGWSIWCAPTWPPRGAGRERAGGFGVPPPGLPAERGGDGRGDVVCTHEVGAGSGRGTGWGIWFAPTWPPRGAGRERAGVFGAPPPGLPAERGGNGLEYLVRPHLASPRSGEGTGWSIWFVPSRCGEGPLFQGALYQGDVHPAVELVRGVPQGADRLEARARVQLQPRAVVRRDGGDDRLLAQPLRL